MVVVELSIVPVGTGSTSVSKYIRQAVDLLKERGLDYRVTPMATVIEGDLDKVMEACKEVHRSVLETEVNRVITTIKIDDRKDKELTMESKVRAVEEG